MNKLNQCKVALIDIMKKPAGVSPKGKKKTYSNLTPDNKKLDNRQISYKVTEIQRPSETISLAIYKGSDDAKKMDLRLSTNKKSENSKCGRIKIMNKRIQQNHSCQDNWSDDILMSEAMSKESEKGAKGMKIGLKRRKSKRLSLYSQSNLTGAKRVSKRLTNFKITNNKKMKKMCLEISSTHFLYGKGNKSHTFNNSSKFLLHSHSTQDKIKNKVIKKCDITNEQNFPPQSSRKPNEKRDNSKVVELVEEDFKKTEGKSTDLNNIIHGVESNGYDGINNTVAITQEVQEECEEHNDLKLNENPTLFVEKRDITPNEDIVTKMDFQGEQIFENKSKVDDRKINNDPINSKIVADPVCDQIDSVETLVYSEVTVESENLDEGHCFTNIIYENDETVDKDGKVVQESKPSDQVSIIGDPGESMSNSSDECNCGTSESPKLEITSKITSGENSLSINE